MYFANCQGNLRDKYLFEVVTSPVIKGRLLGSNSASSDLELPNELEYGLSANVGLTSKDDLGPRILKIELGYYEEDPNSRVFPDKYLHETVTKSRAEVLSAIAAIYTNWESKGFPLGVTLNTTYPKWAEIVGGAMVAAGLGDPCLPLKSEFEVGEDPKTATMREVFRACYEEFGPAEVKKAHIYHTVQRAAPDNDPLEVICPLLMPPEPEKQSADLATRIAKNQARLGYLLREFNNRVLGGIKLATDKSSPHPSRWRYKFVDASGNPYKPRYTAQGITPEPTVSQGATPEPKPDPVGVRVVGVCKGFHSDASWKQSHCEEEKYIGSIVGLAGKPLTNPSTLTPLKYGEVIALDLETFGEPKISGGKHPKIKPSKDALSPQKGEIRLVTLATEDAKITQFDLLSQPLPAEIQEAVSRHPLVIHNAQLDLAFLFAKFGLVPDPVFCTLTASRLLANGTHADSDLGTVLHRYLAVDLPKDQGGSDWGAFALTDAQLEYARNHVCYLLPLKAALERDLQHAGLERVFALESALIPIVVQMEHTGIAVDSSRLTALLEATDRRVMDIATELRAGFGLKDLNLDSPSQLLAAFAKAGVTLPDTAESTLTETAHPLAGFILQYRGQAKFGATVLSLLEARTPENRIMSWFNPLGASSGRFSSSGPNLQNVPRGPLRECFVAPSPEHRLVIADYSQMELRAAAVVAKDAAMIKAFRTGKDLHVETAAAVLGKAVSDVTKGDRQLAKAVNFGLLYGQGARGFRAYAKTSYGVELSPAQATDIRARFFERYTGLDTWHQTARQAADTHPEGRTLMGRRLLPNPSEKDEARRWNRFQMAVNFVIQGSCADVLKLAMTRLMPVLPSSAKLVLTVHDELVLECAADDAKIVAAQTEQVMKEAFREIFGDDVPAEVETHICENWGQKP